MESVDERNPMTVILTHKVERVRNGYRAISPDLGIAARGRSEELARLNLERTIRSFLAPFARAGVLEKELVRMRLRFNSDGSELLGVQLDELPLEQFA